MVVGTLVAGVLLARYGIGTVYATGLVVAVLALVLNLLVPDVRHRGERPSFTLADLARGARTAWERPDLRLLLIVTGAGWMMMNCFFVLEPKFIAEVLKRPEQAVPLIWSAHGGGAILGAFLVSKAYDKGRREPVMVALGVAVVGVAILVYVVPALYASAFVGSALMGLGVASVFAPLLAYIQRTVGEEQRGRVTSVYSAIQEGAAVVSSLAILVFSGVIAVAPALTAAGVAAVAAGLLGAQRARRYDGGKTP
jgi:predicted MFS family arabinose efflux permease